MRAITLWAPWGTYVARHWKRIETRTHPRFRGLVGERIAIHQGLRYDETAFFEARMYRRELNEDVLLAASRAARDERGCIVATAVVHEFVERLDPITDAFLALCSIDTNRFGYVLAKVERLAVPIRCRGHQGIWHVPEWAEDGIRRQVNI